MRIPWPLCGWMDGWIYISKYGLCQCQIKVVHVSSGAMRKGCRLLSSIDINECVYGVFRGLSPLEGALRSRYGAIARWLAHLCYWDKELLFQRVPEVKSTSTTWNGCQGSRRVERHLYTTSYCMPQLLLFLPSLHSLTSMVLRFINSLFMTSAAIKKRKRTRRIQFFCAWPSSLSWFVFCLPSFCFFAFKNLCVATMHEAGVSFTSSLPFYCF